MSYALSSSTAGRRGSLLGLVIGLHVGVFALIMAAKTVVPQILEMPLIVDLIPPVEIPKPPPEEAKPLPMAKPQPVRSQPQPRPAQPQIETTTSTAPAPAAPLAPVVENKPTPPAPPAPEPVSQARFDADYLKNPAPAYPPLSRRMGEEGKVILRVSVTPQGTAEEVEIKTSSGSPRLDEAAQKTVRSWRFIAAKRGDTPVHSWVLVPIIFKLEQ